MSTTLTEQTTPARAAVNLRIDPQSRQLIDDAAAALGKTRTEFMIETARSEAIDVLLDRRLLALEGADHVAFVGALDDAPAPGQRLRALMARTPGWKR